MEKVFAPIVLFTYNRPIHTQNVLDSLALNKEANQSDLYIYCDGAKVDATLETIRKIEEVRRIVANESRFKSITVKIQDKNKGLANSIIEGVTTVVNAYGKVIVVEDDFVFSEFFLKFMNEGLELYEHELDIAEIAGCNYFACGDKFPNNFISPMAETLGWATWANRWSKFNLSPIDLYKELENNDLIYKFNCYGSYDMLGMLRDHILGKVNSWAIQWQATMVLNNMYALHANTSFVNHIESFNATHAPVNILPPLCENYTKITKIKIEEDKEVIKALKLSYSGRGDYFGNLKPKFKRRLIKSYFKAMITFFVPHGIVMLLKKNK